MSAPSFVAVGTARDGGGAVSMPTGVLPNDILILFIESANYAHGAISGWTEVTDSPQGTGTEGASDATRLTMFWKRAGISEGSVTVESLTDHIYSVVLAFRGCPYSGDPFDDTAGYVDPDVNTSDTVTGVTTTGPDRLIVVAGARSSDDSSARFATWTNANITGLTERLDAGSSTGNGGGLGIATGTKEAAGATGDTAVTLSVTASATAYITFALKPAPHPWVRGLGNVAGGTNAVVPTWPTHVAGDVGLLFVESANQAIAAPSGWNEVTNSPQGTGVAGGTSATRLAVFWKRATSGAETNPTVADTGDHTSARIATFRDVADTGDPWDATAGSVKEAASTDVSVAGPTTTVANTLVVVAVATGFDADSSSEFSSWANTNLTGFLQMFNWLHANGNGGGFGVAFGVKETAGDTGTTTATLANSFVNGQMAIALRPQTSDRSADAGLAAGTGAAGEASVTTWNSPSAGLAEGTGSAGAPTVTFGAFAPAGAASGTGTAETGTLAEASFPTPAVGGGIAGDVTALTSAPVNAYPDAATGTATAGQPAGGAEAFAGYAMGFGSGHLAAAGGGTVPAPRGAPLVITVGGTDVSAMTLTGFTFDATLGSVPTASITVADVTEALTWPPDTLAELVIGTAETTWFSGPVMSWQRRALFPGWEYTLRAEGWQRNLALSPVYPTTDVTSSYDGPAGTFVSPYPGHYIGMGDGTPVTDVDVIEGVLTSWWTGPTITYDVPYRVSVSWTIRPRGAPLSSVLDDIAARLGYHDVYWIDGAKVYHQRPGYRGGVAAGALRAPIEHIAPFFLAADTSGGGIVPVTLTDAEDGANVREGVHVIGRIPGANALYVPGPAYGGRDVTSAPESEDIYLSTLLARAYMGGRTEPRRTLSATLPAYSPVPPLGTLLGVEYDPVDPVRRYYLVRAVRAVLAVPGEGIGGIEWSVELGDADRRSYVYEAQDAVEEATEPPEVQVVALEVGPVSDMALGSEQYVYCWPEDENGNKVALGSGRVEWTIWRNSVDVGVGDASIGWWFTGDNPAGITDIVWTEDQPLGFAYITLHCDSPADPGTDAIVVTAQLLVP